MAAADEPSVGVGFVVAVVEPDNAGKEGDCCAKAEARNRKPAIAAGSGVCCIELDLSYPGVDLSAGNAGLAANSRLRVQGCRLVRRKKCVRWKGADKIQRVVAIEEENSQGLKAGQRESPSRTNVKRTHGVGVYKAVPPSRKGAKG